MPTTLSPRRATALTALALLALAACSASDRPPPPPPGDVVTDRVRRDADPNQLGCADGDGDGYGVDCPRGPDCDDDDPAVTDACYRCLRPATGCPCGAPGARVLCDAVTDSDVPGPDGTCHLGQRVCADGVWSRCASINGSGRTILPQSNCGGNCDPTCRQTTVCPDSATDLSNAVGATSSGLVIGSHPPSSFCPMSPPGGLQLPDQTGTGRDTPGGAGPGSCPVPCGGICCGPMQSCVSETTSGGAGGIMACSSGSGSGITSTNQVCGLACPSGAIHCGTAPTDQCCSGDYFCHQGGCVLGNPANCMRSSDCPLFAEGQVCFSFGVCATGTVSNGNCPCNNPPNNGCFTSARAQGFQEIDGIFNTNDGRDARRLRFARYLRGMARSPTSNGPCNSNADCPVGRSFPSSSASDPFPCSTCTPTSAAAFQGFAPGRDYGTVAPFADALDWYWIDFVRYNSAGNPDTSGNGIVPWNGLLFDLRVPSNQVALFSIRNNGNDCCSQGMEWQVWLTDNPGATTVAPAGTIDPQQWNFLPMQRMYTEGWTRNPRSRGVPTDTTDLNDGRTHGNAVADAYTTVWALPSRCHAMRYAAVNVGNTGQPGTSCSTGRVANRLDAVAGLDASGFAPQIYHILPFGVSAGPDEISVRALVQSADIYLLVDTTASMGEEITALRGAITGSNGVVGCTVGTGGLVGTTRCAIPDPWFGVGYLNDFPVAPYGVAGTDDVYRNLLDVTPDADALQSAVGALSVRAGGDAPDAQLPALWSVTTGLGYGVGAGYLAPRTDCPQGRFGYPCFRPFALPLVVLFTDNVFHNGPSDTYLYNNDLLRGSIASFPAPTPVAGNEAADSAYVIPDEGALFVASGDTSAMNDDRATPCAASSGAPDAVFRLNVTAPRAVVFDTAGSSFDTTLHVYASDGTLVGCNDNFGGSQSRVAATLRPGSYFVWVDGAGAARGAYQLRYRPLDTPRFGDAVAALNAVGARVAVIDSCGGASCPAEAVSHARELATQTGSFGAGGAPAVYTIATDGTNLGATTATAISALITNLKMDISAVAEDNPATPAVDERCFVNNPTGTPLGTIRLSSPARGEPAPYSGTQCAGTTDTAGGVAYLARQCSAGATVNFRAEWFNNCVRPAASDQVFTFDVVVRGNGAYEIQRVPVTIVVPRQTFPSTGTYSYDAQATCGASEQIDWARLVMDATVPPGTSIVVDVQTAPTREGLDAAPVVRLGTVTSSPAPALPVGGTISGSLAAAGQQTYHPFLRVRFTLSSDPARTLSPVLHAYQVQFNCLQNR